MEIRATLGDSACRSCWFVLLFPFNRGSGSLWFQEGGGLLSPKVLHVPRFPLFGVPETTLLSRPSDVMALCPD